MTIQWFPGHMAKARREVTEKLKLVDIIFELVDARLPLSSRNPMIDEIIQHKLRIVILNKADMADSVKTNQWLDYFEKQGYSAIAVNAQAGTGLVQITKTAKELLAEKFAKMRAKGIKNPRAIRAMIIGIPNVGKSTLINRIAKKNIAKTGNTPGVTKAQQWIKVNKEIELLDTPGILWPKFDDQLIGYKLAVTGAIKDTLLNSYDIAVFALRFLAEEYPQRLQNFYQLEQVEQIFEEINEVLEHIGKLRGVYGSGGIVDYDKTAELIIHDLRSGQFGSLTFEMPEEMVYVQENK